MKLYVSDSDIIGHRILKMGNLKKFVEVESITLDSYMKKLNLDEKVNFIKIDVEGAKPKVLEGSKKILEKNNDLKIFTEFNREVIKKYGSKPDDMLLLLIKNKFQFFLPNYKTNSLSLCEKDTLLNSEELLKEIDDLKEQNKISESEFKTLQIKISIQFAENMVEKINTMKTTDPKKCQEIKICD